MSEETYLILGGGGMIGAQVVHEIARHLQPRSVIICSRELSEVEETIAHCRREISSVESRAAMYDDVFHDFEAAYARSQLAQLILKHKPHVIVDSINTATAISYQDVYTASEIAKASFDALKHSMDNASNAALAEQSEVAQRDFEALLIQQSIPQLIRHVLIMQRAMTEAGTRLYLKIGTTGTGGMGLNIPYTHSEDKPSA